MGLLGSESIQMWAQSHGDPLTLVLPRIREQMLAYPEKNLVVASVPTDSSGNHFGVTGAVELEELRIVSHAVIPTCFLSP